MDEEILELCSMVAEGLEQLRLQERKRVELSEGMLQSGERRREFREATRALRALVRQGSIGTYREEMTTEETVGGVERLLEALRGLSPTKEVIRAQRALEPVLEGFLGQAG